MEVLLVQTDTVWEDRQANFAAVERLLEASPPSRGALVVLPEMFAVGFSMHVEVVADPPGRPTEEFLARVARAYGCCMLGGSVTRGVDGRGRNEALAVGPDGERLARYEKLHPFSYAGETRYYGSGDRIEVFAWQGFRVAPFICYDLRFPEVYRLAALRGADVLVTIANFPSVRVDHWVHLLGARAIENQAYVVGVNRCGAGPKEAYPGRSLVIDPLGRIVADAGSGECVMQVRLSTESVQAYRQSFPALHDIRRDWFSPGADDEAENVGE